MHIYMLYIRYMILFLATEAPNISSFPWFPSCHRPKKNLELVPCEELLFVVVQRSFSVETEEAPEQLCLWEHEGVFLWI